MGAVGLGRACHESRVMEVADGIHHVWARGNDRQLIYWDDEDCGLYLELLATQVVRKGWRFFAYCLMGNHLHLLLQTPEPNLGAGDAAAARRVRAAVQPPPRTGRARVPGPVRVEARCATTSSSGRRRGTSCAIPSRPGCAGRRRSGSGAATGGCSRRRAPVWVDRAAAAGAVRDDGRATRTPSIGRWSTDDRPFAARPAAERSITRAVEASRYVIFDLDDTLVHSDAVREAFAIVARRVRDRPTDADADAGRRCPAARRGRSSRRSGSTRAQAIDGHGPLPGRCSTSSTRQAPPVAYPDADTTLRELAAHGAQLMLSTGSSARAGAAGARPGGLGRLHASCSARTRTAARAPRTTTGSPQEAPDREWTHRAVTVGDSPQDMRLGAEHGVPVRIGIDRDGDPRPLFAAGATHVVSALAEVVSIVASVRIAA